MPIFRSLRARVLLWVSVALTVLFAATIVGLDATFRRSTSRSVDELLTVQVLGLIALAEESSAESPDQSLTLPDSAVNPQFGVADSGLYGSLWDADGVAVWESASLLGRSLELPRFPAAGEEVRFSVEEKGLPPLDALAFGVTWTFGDGSSLPYTFGVAVSLAPYAEQQAAFRRNLIGWFAGVMLMMLAVITGLLTFVLRPLRRLERQVREVEGGLRARLSGKIPSELEGLARNLNALIETERRRLVRYRNTLDDLAHSLKTPLAAMRTLLSEYRTEASTLSRDLDREVERMDQRVSYQLRRARASGATGLGVAPVSVAPLVEELVETLDKVYRDKQVKCELDLAPDVQFQGDPGDFSELVGNLLENAYKYCRREVNVQARMEPETLVIEIADDGPGIDPDELGQLLERGARADESVPGQGIGLAVVRETVDLYEGKLTFAGSAKGGTTVRVELRRPGFSQ